MASSIMHRATGIALYAGTLLLTLWLGAAAYGEEPFLAVSGILNSMLGRLILIAFTFALCFHLLNGIRHLIWDAGHLFSKQTATLTGWLVFIGAGLMTAIIWLYGLFVMGA